MTAILIVISLVLAWVAKQIATSLIGQQVRGSIPDYTSAKAKAAAKLLPDDVADSYLEDWLAELAALRDKPLSALRFAWGLASAARTIAGLSGRATESGRPALAATRVLDFALIGVLTTLLSPLLTAVAMTVRLGTPSSSIFERRAYIGKGNRPFYQLRFSTLDRTQKRYRLTPVGIFLRRTALEELPVLFSVLRGEMALIGPPAQHHVNGTSPWGESLKVRPGVCSWESLARSGAVDMSLPEARTRDRQRRPRHDVALLCRAVLQVFRRL